MKKSSKLLTFPYIKNITAKAICNAYDFIVGEGYLMAVDDVKMNSFFKTMNEEWIKRYEEYLGISPIDKGALSYEEWLDLRRKSIAASQGNFVYKTEPWLRQQLDAILGDIPYTLYVDHDQYLIIFYVDTDVADDALGQANIIIEDVRPLNMRKFVGKAVGFELPLSQYAYGVSQDPEDNELIYLKMPDQESLTAHLANLIANFVSDKSVTLTIFDDIKGTSQEFIIQNKVVDGSTFQFIAQVDASIISTITRFETSDSEGNALSQFPKDGTGDDLNVPVPSAGMAFNVVWKIIERNLPTTGSFNISWNDDSGQEIVDSTLPRFGNPTQRVYLPLLTRPNQQVESYLVNGVEYEPETYFEMPNGPAAVTAIFKTVLYTLTLHSQYDIYDGPNGSLVPKVRQFTYGEIVDVSAYTIGEENYKDVAVLGLYYNPDFTGSRAGIVTMNRDIELYAYYTPRYSSFNTSFYQAGQLIATVPMLKESYDALFAPFWVKSYTPTYGLIPPISSQPTGWSYAQTSTTSAEVRDIRTNSGRLTVPSAGVDMPINLFSDIVRVQLGTLVAGQVATIQAIGLTQRTTQTAGNGAFTIIEYEQHSEVSIINHNAASFNLWVNGQQIV